MSDLFNADDQSENQNLLDPDNITVDDLVGEGKKYESVEGLVKAYAHSNNHIQGQNKTLDELRADLDKRVTLEEVLERLQSQNGSSNNGGQPPEDTPPTEEELKGLSKEEIEELFTKQIQQHDAQKSFQSNINEVTKVVGEYLGDENQSKAFIADKAAELGMSKEELGQMAGKSPKAFYNLVGIKPQENKGSVRPNTYTKPRPSGEPDSSRLETRADFEKLRRENPREYFKPATQLKMQKLALKAGSHNF